MGQGRVHGLAACDHARVGTQRPTLPAVLCRLRRTRRGRPRCRRDSRWRAGRSSLDCQPRDALACLEKQARTNWSLGLLARSRPNHRLLQPSGVSAVPQSRDRTAGPVARTREPEARLRGNHFEDGVQTKQHRRRVCEDAADALLRRLLHGERIPQEQRGVCPPLQLLGLHRVRFAGLQVHPAEVQQIVQTDGLPLFADHLLDQAVFHGVQLLERARPREQSVGLAAYARDH